MGERYTGAHSPLALLNSVFFYNGLYFVLRGGDEHRNLKISQLTFREVDNPSNPDEKIGVVEYREFSSKNRPGGRHKLNLQNKVITHYARPDLGERCFVYLLKFYLSKLPKVAHEKDVFYWKEHTEIPTVPGKPWYKAVPLGHNTLTRKLKDMFE